MAKTYKYTEAEKKKIRYRAIRNAYGSKELADRYKSRSDERILAELGLRIPKTLPELKPIPTGKTLARNVAKLKRFQEATSEIGLTPEEALSVKQNSKKRIRTFKQFLDEQKNFDKTPAGRTRRIRLWAEWSKNQLPPKVHKEAKRINKEIVVDSKQLDDTDSYGYAVQYYMFIDGKTEEEIRKIFVPARDLNDSGQFVRSHKDRRRKYS